MPDDGQNTCSKHVEFVISVTNQLDAQNFCFTSLFHASTCLEHMHSSSVGQNCDDTTGCVIQFWPPYDEHMCSKHVEAWNKLVVKQKLCASSWLITEINILRFPVSKTSTNVEFCSKNKFEKSVHLVGFIIRINHDARSSECQIRQCWTKCKVSLKARFSSGIARIWSKVCYTQNWYSV